MNDNILILGGTGFVGRALCDKLVERFGGGGAQIVVPSRKPPRAKYLQLLPTVRLVACDIHDEAQLMKLVPGCDAVINLVGVLHGSKADFERAHVELPLKLSRACSAAGVRRVIHISALGASSSAPSQYLRTKAAGQAVLEAAGLDLTILRPSVIFGEHDHFLNLFAKLQTIFPVIPLASASSRFQPVWVQDVAAAIAFCLDERSTIGKTFECAGPQIFTLKQLVQLAGRWSGRQRPILALPDALGRAQALVMEMLPGAPLVSRDNLASMRVPNVATGQLPGLAALGIAPTSLGSVVPDYLGSDRGLARLNHWRARGGA